MEHTRQPLTEGQAIDLFVAYRFLRILTTPWEKQEAFKLGMSSGSIRTWFASIQSMVNGNLILLFLF